MIGEILEFFLVIIFIMGVVAAIAEIVVLIWLVIDIIRDIF